MEAISNSYDAWSDSALDILNNNVNTCTHESNRIQDEYRDIDRNRVTVFKCTKCGEVYSVITKLKEEYKDD